MIVLVFIVMTAAIVIVSLLVIVINVLNTVSTSPRPTHTMLGNGQPHSNIDGSGALL